MSGTVWIKRKVNRNDILSAALRTFGPAAQTDMMIEEMSELTKALIKERRMTGSDEAEMMRRVDDIREEIADVQIMLDQMKILYGDVEKHEDAKLSRLMTRILDAEP